MSTEKLPIEFKEKWVAALRSGEYKQGDACLYSQGSFCCLGVACVVAGLPTDMLVHNSYIPIGWDLPKALRGIPSDNEVVSVLTLMNDGDRRDGSPALPFTAIADYIETNL